MIPPGQVGKLHAKLDTSALTGLVGKGISILTNDPAVASVQVVIRARVVGSVLMQPGYKALLSNRRDMTKATHFLIRQEPGEVGEIEITGARASVPWIDVEVRELTEKYPAEKGVPAGWPGDWILRATLKEGAPNGNHKPTVHFKTGLTREPEVELQIAVDVQPPVNLNSGEIRIVAGQPAMVLASTRQGLSQDQVKLSPADARLSARTEAGRGRFFKIHLEWSGPPPDAPVELRMQIGNETQTAQVVIAAE